MDLSHRVRVAEIMDDPALPSERHQAALAGLRRINRFSRSAEIVWREIAPLMTGASGRTFSLLDVACGSGDVPVALWKLARHAGLSLDVVGCDVSERAVGIANQWAGRDRASVQFVVRNALNEPCDRPYDFVTVSLFMHHLSDDDAIRLLQSMARCARIAVIVNDLRRSHWGYWLAWVGARVLTRSDVVRFDAPASVAAAFTMPEFSAMALKAGLENGSIHRRWPARFVYRWMTP